MKANRERLETAMARACLTSREVAKAAGLPRPTFNNVLSGKSVLPATLGRVARALGVDVVEIMEQEAST